MRKRKTSKKKSKKNSRTKEKARQKESEEQERKPGTTEQRWEEGGGGERGRGGSWIYHPGGNNLRSVVRSGVEAWIPAQTSMSRWRRRRSWWAGQWARA